MICNNNFIEVFFIVNLCYLKKIKFYVTRYIYIYSDNI